MPGYFSEIAYDGNAHQDFIEVAVPTGTDVSGWTVLTYHTDGTLQETFSLGSSTQTISGRDVYVINDSTTGFTDIGATRGYALVDGTGTVQQFISFSEPITATEGAAAGQSAQQMGDLTGSGESMETTDGGSTYQAQSTTSEGTIVCYAPGTLIETPRGPRAVETLRPGDLVLTLDHGAQPILWTRSRYQSLDGVEDDGKPVLIQARSLGKGLLEQDLVVSPQHRILVGGGGQLTAYFKTEAFVPAKSLTKLPGIRHMKGKRGIAWVHIACEGHEVVTANGCLSESLLLGPMVLKAVTVSERQALIDIIGAAPSPGAALNGPQARKCLRAGVVRRAIAGTRGDGGKCVAAEIRKWDLDLAMDRYETQRLHGSELMEQRCRDARGAA